MRLVLGIDGAVCGLGHGWWDGSACGWGAVLVGRAGVVRTH